MGNCVTWKGKLCIIVNSSVRKQVGLMTRQQKALLDMISIIITKLIEIAVNHAKIASLLFHHHPQSVFPVVMVTCSLLWVACFFFFFFPRKLSIQDAFKKLRPKNVIHGSTCVKEKKIFT